MAKKRIKKVSPDKIKEIKQRAHAWGIWAERMAVILLWFKGYKILKRRYRNAHGEIDIIAKRANTLVFIEVKARKSQQQAAESITARQRIRIEKTAMGFMSTSPSYANMQVRFDAVLCLPATWPEHIESAWRPIV